MSDLTLAEEMEELSSAEDFLDFFEVEYDAKVVHINRLHIMQRYHDYLHKGAELIDEDNDDAAMRDIYKKLLTQAYSDFVDSDAKTEKVLKIYKMSEPQSTFVSVDQLLGA